MFCPLCQAEYPEGILKCADCDVDLVSAFPSQQESSVGDADLHLLRLWRGADPVLHSAVIAVLQGMDIPFFDNPPRDYENWLSAREQTGINLGVPNYDVQVPESRFGEAVEALNELLAMRDRPLEEDKAPAEEES